MSGEAKLEALEWQVLQNPSSTAKTWTELAKATTLSGSFPSATARAVAVTMVYERAVRALPYSYKMWRQYIEFRQSDTRALCSANEWFQSVRDVYERALERLPQMPLLWVAYVEFIMAFPLLRVTMVRHVVGRSLAALPATQHHLVWRLVKRWSADPAVPRATFRQLWAVYLQLDASTAARRQYFTLLQRRQDTAEYVRECARVVSEVAAKPDPAPAETRLFEDTAFWEPLLLAFQSPGWFLEEGKAAANSTTDQASGPSPTTLMALDALMVYGRRYCASALALELSYIGFLYGQGHTAKGREALDRMLTEAPDPHSFAQVYRVAVELEDQVVESFILSEATRELHAEDKAAYVAVAQHIFGSPDPCARLQRLVREYPMLVNQSQLRSRPRCVPLWLKRAELLQERITHSTATTTAHLASLYQQAIAQCTGGLESVDAAAAQLIHSHALSLCEAGQAQEAGHVLRHAAWSIRFSAAAANAALLGLYTEVQLLSAAPAAAVAAALVSTLTAGTASAPSSALASGVAARRKRGALLASLGGGDGVGAEVAPSSLLASDARPWLLAADLTRESAVALAEVTQRYGGSAAYTAEGAVHMACVLWQRFGDEAGATRELEKAITRFRGDAVATLFVAQQYLAFLCVSRPRDATAATPFAMHRFRELLRVVEGTLPAALQRAPAAALDLVVSCAFVERWCGLYGNAVRVLQHAAEVALQHLDHAAHFVLLSSIVEKAVRCAQRFKGCPGTRQCCSALLRRTTHAPLLQRIALHWAAVERRCGNAEQAYAVLDACGDSQNPATPHGAVYWKLWESLCISTSDFERLVRRKQQVEVRFHKRPKPAASPEE